MSIQTIDGACYARMLSGGAACLCAHAAELNDLNQEDGYLKAEIVTYPVAEQPQMRESDAVAMTRALKDIFSRYCKLRSRFAP